MMIYTTTHQGRMLRSRATNLAMVFATLSVAAAVGQETVCEDGKPLPKATIGQEFDIKCSSSQCSSVQWHRVFENGTKTLLVNETDNKLVVSQNVKSAAEVGGRVYECNCDGVCKKYNISVIPRVNLVITPNVTRSGGSVNVTCTAESYPPANTVGNYLMEHPLNKPITRMLLQNKSGVVHTIQSAENGHDEGVYKCTVSVQLPTGDFIQSNDISEAYLTVYDPPTIEGVKNFSMCQNNQLTLLECVIHNPEEGLAVWSNWSTVTGKDITSRHFTWQNGSVFYLLLYNATPGEYICRVFSDYSTQQPEDSATAAVEIIPDTPYVKGELTKNGETAITILAVFCVIFLIILLIVIIASFIIFFRYRHRVCNHNVSHHVHSEVHGLDDKDRYVELPGKKAASLSEVRDFSPADKSMTITGTQTETPASTEAAITPFLSVPVESTKQEKTEANRSMATTGTQTETPASTEAASTTEPLQAELTMEHNPSHSELVTEIPSPLTQSYSESEPQRGESGDDECDDSQVTSQIVAGNIKQTLSLAICHQSTSMGVSPDSPGLKSSPVTAAKPPPAHLRQRSFSTSSVRPSKRRLSWGGYKIFGETDHSTPERKTKTSPGGNGKAHVHAKEDSLEEVTSRMEKQHTILTSEPMKTGVAPKKQRPISATLPRNFRITPDSSPEQWRQPSDSNVAQRKRRMKRTQSSPSALQPLLPIEGKAASADEETYKE